MTGKGACGESDGATALGPDRLDGLIPTWIATQEDLNVAEQANVLKAIGWAYKKFGPG